MTKLEIINEIKRTAAANGGAPLGSRLFATQTGIREPEWKGKLWARWSDALREAGFEPNQLVQAYSEDSLLEKYATLATKLGRLPAKSDMRLSVRNGLEFPDWNTFTKKFGGKPQLVSKLREYCQAHSEHADVVALCDAYVPADHSEAKPLAPGAVQIGFVYLMKSGKYYKIGKASISERRHRELAIQMPERLIFVHEIKTDDPFGIEAYWHNRFAGKRKNGEWFDLGADDVAAFKRRTFM